MRKMFVLLALCSILLVTSFIAQVAATPSVLISKLWGGTGRDRAFAIATDQAGNMFVTGDTSSFGPNAPLPSLFLLKYSPSGTLLWERIWSNTTEVAFAIALDHSGNIFVSGYTANAVNGGQYYALLVKFNSAGGLLWEKNWGVSGNFDVGYGLATDATGNVYLVGESQYVGPTNSFHAIIMKFDSTGTLLWQKTWGGSYLETAAAAAVDAAGNLYVTGTTESFNFVNHAQIFVLKVSPAGSLLFEKVIGGTMGDFGYGIAVDKAGSILVAGESCSAGAGNCDAILVKLDSTSGLIWQRTWGGTNGTDIARAVVVDSSGNAFVTGETNSYGQGGSCSTPAVCNNMFLLKITSSGSLGYQLVYGGRGTGGTYDGHDYGRGVALDQYGNAVVAGIVGQAPPYIIDSGNNTLGNATLPYGAFGNNTFGNPGFTIVSRIGTVGTPSGSETWQGTTKALLFKYSSSPSGLALNPLSILFGGILACSIVISSRRARTRSKNASQIAARIAS